jgi:PadR family transcriptional regulator, regulatory protein PadR
MATSTPADDVLRTHLQELRRGTVVAASLIALARPGHGYALLRDLAEHGFVVDANTLYPLLRRLEEQGLLTSEWNTEESRPRKLYRTSPEGERILAALLEDMEAVRASITSLRAADRATPSEGKN